VLIREEIQLNSITKSKEYPIMNGINKNSLQRHGCSAENMNKCSF
jgi:hypothetical protein